jgi:hypothetical protein
MLMDRFKESMDRYITGNYGENQFKYWEEDEEEKENGRKKNIKTRRVFRKSKTRRSGKNGK